MSTRVEVHELKYCDIHKYDLKQEGVVAHYDGKTKRGPWANMCGACFAKLGIGLGTGKGQQLIYPEGLIK